MAYDLGDLTATIRDLANSLGDFADVFAPPYKTGSNAKIDHDRNNQRRVPGLKQALTALTIKRSAALNLVVDHLLGIAACIDENHVLWAPFPLARGVLVTAARNRYILSAPTPTNGSDGSSTTISNYCTLHTT